MQATGRYSGEAMASDGGRGVIPKAASRRSVFRYVLARGVLVLLIIFALGMMATGSLFHRAAEERVLAQRHLPMLAAASRLYANTAILGGLSTRLLTVESKSELRTLVDRVAGQSAAVAADIERMEALGLEPAKAARARIVHRDLVDGAEALAGITEEILTGSGPTETLENRRKRLIQRQELISSEVTTLMSGLARDTELEVSAFQNDVLRSGYWLAGTMGLGAVAAVLAVLALYRDTRRHMLDRLRTLTEAAREWRLGGRGDIPVDERGDEISEMAGALRDLISAANRRTEELAAQAQTDMLTGMFNRRGFQQRAEAELARAGRYGTPLTVLVGDIDHFKQVNDTHGHAVGDAALRHVAALWQDVLRDSDISGRLGGEEFAALLPHTDADAAIVVAERIRGDLAVNDLPLAGGGMLIMTISIGIATAAPGEGLSSLLARADDALYAAKRAGRNRVLLADGTAVSDQASAL